MPIQVASSLNKNVSYFPAFQGELIFLSKVPDRTLCVLDMPYRESHGLIAVPHV